MGGAGLSALFRTNPYEKRVQGMEKILPRSGFARPLIMGEMGKTSAEAERFDEEKGATMAGLYAQERGDARQTALMKDADETFKTAAEVAKHDPIAATKLIQAKAGANKFLEPLKDVVFRRSIDGKSVMEVKDEKGQVRGIINTTDMLLEADKAAQTKGQDLTPEERAGLAQKYFYPTPGYEKPSAAADDKNPTVGTVREGFRNRSGVSMKFKERYMGAGKWEPFGDEVPEHGGANGEGGPGRVKSTDSKALKIELARKYAPLAKRLLKEKAAKAVGPEMQKTLDQIKVIDDALAKKDPLTGDISAEAVYAALPEEQQSAFDRIYLDAEEAFPKAGRVAGAVNDAISGYHKSRKAAAPAKPASPAGGTDWKKYLKR